MCNRASRLLLPRLYAAIALGLFLCAGPGTSAQAHRLLIFAWPEADRICTESYYTRKIKAHQATVSMQTTNGQELAKSTSTKEGISCFPLPQEQQDLLFVAEAGQGHRGTFVLSVARLQSFGQLTNATLPAGSGTPLTDSALDQPPLPKDLLVLLAAEANTMGATPANATLRAAPAAPLQKDKTTARQQELDRQQEQAPGLWQVAAGLACIASVTILLLVARRKRQS